MAFATTAFLAAFLLFAVQPLTAKALLPLLGGYPEVWTTCMLFFQGMLLAGYAYAHVSTRVLGAKKQAIGHMILILAACAFFPLAFPNDAPVLAGKKPVSWLLGRLTVEIGLPFFVVATSSPLVLTWCAFAIPGRVPYSLYAASNFGSLLALLGYPTLIEPLIPLSRQKIVWVAGYVLLAVLIAACAFRAR
ncbi:MAG: hypothetical protein NVSMB14_17100 [Isosphaeraceae bacterium]